MIPAINVLPHSAHTFSIRTSRPTCPFYGFAYFMNALNDTGGNQCALEGTYAPCRYAFYGQPARWECEAFDVAGIVKSAPPVTVYPEEVAGQGVSLKEWVWMLMAKEPQS